MPAIVAVEVVQVESGCVAVVGDCHSYSCSALAEAIGEHWEVETSVPVYPADDHLVEFSLSYRSRSFVAPMF